LTDRCVLALSGAARAGGHRDITGGGDRVVPGTRAPPQFGWTRVGSDDNDRIQLLTVSIDARVAAEHPPGPGARRATRDPGLSPATPTPVVAPRRRRRRNRSAASSLRLDTAASVSAQTIAQSATELRVSATATSPCCAAWTTATSTAAPTITEQMNRLPPADGGQPDAGAQACGETPGSAEPHRGQHVLGRLGAVVTSSWHRIASRYSWPIRHARIPRQPDSSRPRCVGLLRTRSAPGWAARRDPDRHRTCRSGLVPLAMSVQAASSAGTWAGGTRSRRRPRCTHRWVRLSWSDVMRLAG
jgi:hypothetical protein